VWTDGPAADADGGRDLLLVDGTTEYQSRHGLGRPVRLRNRVSIRVTDGFGFEFWVFESVLVVVVVVVLSNVDIGDPRCPIHGEDAIFTHKL